MVLIGWRAWPSPGPPHYLIGCAAQMTSQALLKKPSGRPLCSPEPIAGVGGLTSPPTGPREAQRAVDALAAGRRTRSRDSRVGEAETSPGTLPPGSASWPRLRRPALCNPSSPSHACWCQDPGKDAGTPLRCSLKCTCDVKVVFSTRAHQVFE